MRCQRCGNKELRYFYKDHEAWYCRKCIVFGRVNVGELPVRKVYTRKKLPCSYELKYPLTPSQQRAEAEILNHLQHHQNILVYAACGAGKTELVMGAIQMYLRKGKKVGFAISRRQVVLEIRERMASAFPTLRVIAVCEGFTNVSDGDLIICTMHQLYRYHQTFDLLIMDEVDAFPYRDNKVLEQIAHHAGIGEIIYLTATPSEEMLNDAAQGRLQLVELFQRPHGYPLIVPQVRRGLLFMQMMILLHVLLVQHRNNVQTLVFVPTIAMAVQLQKYLRFLVRCAAFTSKTKDKEKILEGYHKQAYEVLICTTILERGITIKGVDVIILHADHPVFNEASLIQIIGRVGRNIEIPTGHGWFLCKKQTRDIKRCITALHKMNESS